MVEHEYDEATVDALAREIYQARSMSAREMTDERWARIKRRFPGSVGMCREQAVEMIDSGEWED